MSWAGMGGWVGGQETDLEHGTLAVRAGGDRNHVLRVLDGHDDTGGKHQLLPGLALLFCG